MWTRRDYEQTTHCEWFEIIEIRVSSIRSKEKGARAVHDHAFNEPSCRTLCTKLNYSLCAIRYKIESTSASRVRLAARNLPRMTIIKLAAIVLDKLMRQERTGGSRLGEFDPVYRRTDDDTVMMHAITERSTEEACRIRTSRLSIALTSAIFLRGYLSRRFIGDEGGGHARSLASSHG